MTNRRRDFLAGTVALGASGFVGAGALAFGQAPENIGKGAADEAVEVAPVEDLMREHGVLKRVLLIYDEGLRRLDANQEVPLKALRKDEHRHALGESLRHFIRMFSAHEAREDTVLFPALRDIVSANEYDALGEEFEKKEHRLFGENGFEEIVGRVAEIEKGLGFHDLAQFTRWK